MLTISLLILFFDNSGTLDKIAFQSFNLIIVCPYHICL